MHDLFAMFKPPTSLDLTGAISLPASVDGIMRSTLQDGTGQFGQVARPANLSAKLDCRGGIADERHLAPYFLNLVAQRRPAVVFAEQVTDSIKHGWLDGIYEGLEGNQYAIGSKIIPGVCVGSPQRRYRIFIVGDRGGEGLEGHTRNGDNQHQQGRKYAKPAGSITPSGFWAGAEWVKCKDGRFRLDESRLPLLVNGLSDRVVIRLPAGQEHAFSYEAALTGFGNAIIPQVAAEFIGAFMDTRG